MTRQAASLRTTKLLRTVRLIKLVRLLRLLKLEELFESAAEVLQIDARYLMFGVLMFQQVCGAVCCGGAGWVE